MVLPALQQGMRSLGWLLALVLGLTACTGGPTPTVATATADPALTAQVTTTFATYRAGVEQGDADAVLQSIDRRSRAAMGELAQVAAEGGEQDLRALPAVEQLLVLTYRLRPELLRAEDPYAALVEGGFAGQDRSLGGLGRVIGVDERLALGEVTDVTTGEPTAQRWRFVRQDGRWRFDLVAAHQLLSTAIETAARRSGVGVDEVVTATVVDLSGEAEATVQRLYTDPPAG